MEKEKEKSKYSLFDLPISRNTETIEQFFSYTVYVLNLFFSSPPIAIIVPIGFSFKYFYST